MITAQVAVVIAARIASWSASVTGHFRCTKPGISGPKPLTIFSDPAAAMAPVDRPWNAPSKATISTRSGWPASWWNLRAILIASSAVSVPELVKNTVSAKVVSVKSFASRSCSGIV